MSFSSRVARAIFSPVSPSASSSPSSSFALRALVQSRSVSTASSLLYRLPRRAACSPRETGEQGRRSLLAPSSSTSRTSCWPGTIGTIGQHLLGGSSSSSSPFQWGAGPTATQHRTIIQVDRIRSELRARSNMVRIRKPNTCKVHRGFYNKIRLTRFGWEYKAPSRNAHLKHKRGWQARKSVRIVR